MADSPAEAEAAQALFCAMADKIGTDNIKTSWFKKGSNTELKYETYGEFKSKNKTLITDSFKKTNLIGLTLGRIEKFLIEKDGWYESSIKIATKLIEDITQIDESFDIGGKGFQDIIYYRGAKGGKNIMNTIELLFKVANKNENLFGDVNKWSPADIYFASKEAEKAVDDKYKETLNPKKSGAFNFFDLNEFINGLLDDGQLLGVSLKKSGELTQIKKINFQKDINQEIIEKVKYAGIKLTKRDVQIYFNKMGSKPLFKIRHDPSSDRLSASPTIKCEVEGGSARLGSLTSFGTATGTGLAANGITDIWARQDKGFATTLSDSFITGVKNYTTAIQKLNKKYAGMVGSKLTGGLELKKELKVRASKNQIKNCVKLRESVKLSGFDLGLSRGLTAEVAEKRKATLYDCYKNERIVLSVKHIVSSFNKKMEKYFKGDSVKEEMKDKVLRGLYIYASGMSPSSGKFVIAK